MLEDTWGRERPADPASGHAEIDGGLAGLVSAGLLSVSGRPHGKKARYRIHPVIVAAARSQVGGDFRQLVDATLAAYWRRVYLSARATEGAGSTSKQVRWAAGAAVPYVLRQGRPAVTLDLLDEVLLRDGSATTVRAAGPALRAVAAATSGATKARATLALLNSLDADATPADDELFTEELFRSELRAAFEEAGAVWRAANRQFTESEYRAHSALDSHFIRLDLNHGRYGDAMESADQQIALAGHMGMGPWTRLEAEVTRLEVAAATAFTTTCSATSPGCAALWTPFRSPPGSRKRQLHGGCENGC